MRPKSFWYGLREMLVQSMGVPRATFRQWRLTSYIAFLKLQGYDCMSCKASKVMDRTLSGTDDTSVLLTYELDNMLLSALRDRALLSRTALGVAVRSSQGVPVEAWSVRAVSDIAQATKL